MPLDGKQSIRNTTVLEFLRENLWKKMLHSGETIVIVLDSRMGLLFAPVPPQPSPQFS